MRACEICGHNRVEINWDSRGRWTCLRCADRPPADDDFAESAESRSTTSASGPTRPSLTVKPQPQSKSQSVSTSAGDEDPETTWKQLVAAYEHGGLTPVEIRLRDIPSVADPAGHLATIVRFVQLAFGLRQAGGEDRPIPLGQHWIQSNTRVPASRRQPVASAPVRFRVNPPLRVRDEAAPSAAPDSSHLPTSSSRRLLGLLRSRPAARTRTSHGPRRSSARWATDRRASWRTPGPRRPWLRQNSGGTRSTTDAGMRPDLFSTTPLACLRHPGNAHMPIQ
jgi:hypothetical protein